MPKKRTNQEITCGYFTWTLYQRDGVFYADGRGNPHRLGRHSLGTRDHDEAVTQLRELDQVHAVAHGLAKPSHPVHEASAELSLEAGRCLYETYLNRPEVAGGPCEKTRSRYRAAFDKFLAFSKARNISRWNEVNRGAIQAYLSYLEKQDYADATLYLEGTFLKQVIKFLIAEKHLPESSRVTFELRKPSETTTYCYTSEEFRAMLDHCRAKSSLQWLGDVIAGLGMTGLRISELASLRWTDVDLGGEMIYLTNDLPRLAGSQEKRRRTKNRRDRSLPIHPELRPFLQRMKRQPHGLVFTGPQGGKLDPDRVRIALVEDVLTPLSERFPKEGDQGLLDGRLHSFRHYFCSWAANSSVPERTVMAWLGHSDAKMITRYYHLNDSDSIAQMKKLKIADRPDGEVASEDPAA